ncbi:putative microtubule-actin cross-linking factor 1 isoform X3 [Apostichopus japonicus]|uniref:Putative microtubule-actin cross-linking factor 1 isoform X3 n=1 Tax=Stichopus japonicus TaxID=307972 RepID=A0A2G8JQE3_STIJA|nr:putative microtubule-actin cross-linking factor 1 isoform X3 [Apostichopus japonicus]
MKRDITIGVTEQEASRQLQDTCIPKNSIICFITSVGRAKISTMDIPMKLLVGDIEDHGDDVSKVRRLGDELTVHRSNQAGAEAILGQMNAVEERWIRLQDKAKVRTQSLEAAINSLSDFEIAANRLETWLNEKAKMLAVLGPIGIEPDILKNQKSQVEVLQDEFDSHKGQLDNLQDAARAILDKQDSNTRSRSPIQHQINEIQEQWEDLKRQLDDREGQLDNVLKESEPFHETKQDLNDWLIDFSNRISSLPAISQNPELVKQQREHTKALQKEADRKKQQLASMGDHHQQLVKLNPELTAMSEVELKLESVQSPYDDWCRKLDERLGKLQAALVQSQDFEDALDNMARWLDSKDKEVSSPKPISARPDVLRRQVIEHEELPKEIVKQVYTYQRLADKMDSLVQESESGPERRALEQKRDDMKSRWTDLERRVAERKDRLVDCSEKAKEYTDECNQFLPWLRSVEDRINSLGPVLMKPNVVKRQYDILRQLQDDINRHKDNHRALNDNSERLVRCTDVDHPFIRDQVKDINTRWDKLNADVARNVETLEGLNDRLSTFQENVNQSSSLLASCEGRLANQDSGRDRLSLDNLKINDEVDGMVRRYQKLKGIVNDKYMQLEAGNQEVVKYQPTLKAEDDLDRMDPVARDLPTLDKQNKDIQTFQDDLELLKGTILKAETAYKDIIDRGFMSDPEGFREQIENINKRWLKIRERANTRHADIDRTNARMQDLKHLFDEVNGGLDKAEMEIRGWKPVGADVDTIKRQEKEFKAYMRNLVDPLTPRVRDANRLCQNLVQSAAPRVSTTALEGDLKRMNDRWNSLLEKNNQRRGNLNEGLLRCGKFQEALQSLLSWISDTEAMVKNQSGPSSDYNVLKAQMSEQQLCDRIITDREPSVSSLKEMGEQLAKVSDPQDRMRIQQQLSDLERRWNNLKDTVKDRRQKLEQTERLARVSIVGSLISITLEHNI